jgi:GT2 family glycosyltransferase
MKLSVIIVNYNVKYYAEQCIESVFRAAKGIDFEVFVVDNHSHDGSVEYLTKRFGERITLIDSNHNLGFARANNIAIRQATGQYILLLNPDTFVSEDSLSMVLDFMDTHPKAGACGVMMFNPDGTRAKESRRGLPTPYVSFLKMLGRSERYYMSNLPWDKEGQIDVISGAFCMLTRKCLDNVGLLDETFFMYGEDIDLSYRVKKAGYENWYVPATILHYKGESTQKTSFRYVHVFYQAMLIFFRKHFGHLSFLVTIPVSMAIYMRAFIALIQMGYNQIKRSLGFFDEKATQPNYIFVGGNAMLAECRKLARRKGLTASFCSNRDDAIIDGPACVVYDTSVWSFADLLKDASKHVSQDVTIGTYSCKSRVLITPKETIK